MPDETPTDAPNPVVPEGTHTHARSDRRQDLQSARNKLDDERQTHAEDRISASEVTLRDLWEMSKDNRDAIAAAARDNQFAIIQVKQGIDAKIDAQGERIDTLVQTTNHRMENFENALALAHIEFNQKIGRITANSVGAISTPDLAQTLIRQLVRSKLIWLLFSIPVLVFAPVVVDHWGLLFERVVHFTTNLPFGL